MSACLVDEQPVRGTSLVWGAEVISRSNELDESPFVLVPLVGEKLGQAATLLSASEPRSSWLQRAHG